MVAVCAGVELPVELLLPVPEDVSVPEDVFVSFPEPILRVSFDVWGREWWREDQGGARRVDGLMQKLESNDRRLTENDIESLSIYA